MLARNPVNALGAFHAQDRALQSYLPLPSPIENLHTFKHSTETAAKKHTKYVRIKILDSRNRIGDGNWDAPDIEGAEAIPITTHWNRAISLKRTKHCSETKTVKNRIESSLIRINSTYITVEENSKDADSALSGERVMIVFYHFNLGKITWQYMWRVSNRWVRTKMVKR